MTKERLNTEILREFWSALNNLGPRQTNYIPMQVYDDEGNITGKLMKLCKNGNLIFIICVKVMTQMNLILNFTIMS